MRLRDVVPPNRAKILVVALAILCLATMGQQTVLAITAQLQGQSTNSSVWIAGNVQGWGELDLIPTRVLFTAGPGSNVAVEVVFDHTKTTGSTVIPGIQNLLNFTASNVVFNSGPSLHAPAGSNPDIWSYVFNVNVTNTTGTVEFRSQMSPGANNNTGSSLALSGTPALGTLQVHKPEPKGTNDLAVTKIGPATALRNQTITYTLSYTNKTGDIATGLQLSDTLPTNFVTYVAASCSGGCSLLGNTLIWSLPDLPAGAGGTQTYQVTVKTNAPIGQSFMNGATVFSAAHDLNPGDNSTEVITTVISGCVPASIGSDPLSVTICAGGSASFTVTANGSAPFSYRWRKNSIALSDTGNISGSTNVTLTINPVGTNDAASYDVVVTNACGSAISGAATLTVNTAAQITCPLDMTLAAAAGQCSTNVAFTVIGTGSPSPTVECKIGSTLITSPHVFSVGTTTVNCTSSNVCSSTNCSFTVTVNDTEPPIIGCPANVTTNTTVGQCAASGVVLGSPSTSDNCSLASLSNDAPAQFSVGVTEVHWTVTDASGNAAGCTQTVTVVDNQPPAITACPANIATNTDPGQCSATGVVLGSPITSDNCGTTTVSSNAPSSFSVGTNFVVWTVSDTSGNSTICTQRVIVVDNQPPAITVCPANITTNTDPGQCSATGVVLGSPIASDNCGVASIVSNAPNSFSVGTNLVVWTITDVNSNASVCTQRVIVVDNQPPAITSCPANITTNTSPGQCSASGVVLGSPIASDDCGVASIVSNAPNNFSVGTNLVVWTITDVNSNASVCTQRVIVVDNQPPAISCPANVVTNTSLGQCSASGVALGSPFTSDNCVVASVTSNAPASFPRGTNMVVWTVTDTSGNSNVCTQRVIVVDNQPPAITCPANVVTNVSPGQCSASGVILGTPLTSDNCSVASVVNNAPGSYPRGTNAVVWTVTDTSGNSTLCTQRVIVVDNQAPSLTCPLEVQVQLPAGQCCASGVALGSPAIGDNCGVVSVTNNAPSRFPLGMTFVTWTVTDVNGNSASCTQPVIVYLEDPDRDTDGDGLSDGLECLIGSDPLDSSSGLSILGIQRVGSDIHLSWRTVGNSTNFIQLVAPSPGGGYSNNFTDIGSMFVPGAGDVIVDSIDPGGATNDPARFYRIRLQPGARPCSP